MSDANRSQPSHARTQTGMHGLNALRLFGALTATMVLLQFVGLRDLLEYARDAVLNQHQYWRLLTGHLVHDSVRHLGLNALGLAVITLFFSRHFSLLEWAIVALASIVAIDIGLVWNEPQVHWYVGLSGCLHGVLAASAIQWWRYESKSLALMLTVLVIAKLGWEQYQGGLPLSGDMPVIVNAHLYGAIGGAVGALGLLCGHHRWPRRT